MLRSGLLFLLFLCNLHASDQKKSLKEEKPLQQKHFDPSSGCSFASSKPQVLPKKIKKIVKKEPWGNFVKITYDDGSIVYLD